jgi:Mitochondrial domain of unknown function (DUF1713)
MKNIFLPGILHQNYFSTGSHHSTNSRHNHGIRQYEFVCVAIDLITSTRETTRKLKCIMFAARRVSSLLARRTALSRATTPAAPLTRRGYALPRLQLPSPTSAIVTSRATQPTWWFQKLSEIVETAIFQMSSTMKKRRSKMNKHKLRKRRKLLRRKSK